MAGTPASGLRKVCELSAEQLEKAWYEYLEESEAGDRSPSLPDYLGAVNRKHHTRLTEKTVQAIFAAKDGIYKNHAEILAVVLMGLRGEYLSNPRWSGAQSTKAMLALGKDYGDGVTYSAKDSGKQGVEALSIRFGSDEMSCKAGK